jgi:uncharacterized protein YbcI
MASELAGPQHEPEVDSDRQGGSLLAAISNAMVRARKQYYGKGPTKAKSYMVDNYLFIAMEGGLTVVEETLLRAGKHDLVREVRQTFQNEMATEFTDQIEGLTGRKVLTYQSQLTFDPHAQFEIFVLDPTGDGTPETEATAEAQSPGTAPVGEAEEAAVGEERRPLPE